MYRLPGPCLWFVILFAIGAQSKPLSSYKRQDVPASSCSLGLDVAMAADIQAEPPSICDTVLVRWISIDG